MDKNGVFIGSSRESITLSLENLAQFRNPRLSIRLESDDDDGGVVDNGTVEQQLLSSQHSYHSHLKHSAHSQSSEDLNSNSDCSLKRTFNKHTQQNGSKNCHNCDSFRHLLFIRDKTIMKLAEDRDEMKIKLTKTMNMNIELTRQLMKYHTLSTQAERAQNVRNESVASGLSRSNESMNRSPKSPLMGQLRDEVADLRRKCAELDGLYQTFKHNMHSLRGVYTELASPEKLGAAPVGDHNTCLSETEADYSETSSVSHNFGQELNPHKEDLNNNHNNDINAQQHRSASFQRTSSPIEASTKAQSQPQPQPQQNKPAALPVQPLTTEKLEPEQEPVSSFDAWYNS